VRGWAHCEDVRGAGTRGRGEPYFQIEVSANNECKSGRSLILPSQSCL
jgi:hypothetical protein